MDKVIVKLYVPMLDEQYDVKIPVSREVNKLIELLVKAINELSGWNYTPTVMPMLYDKTTAGMYDINLTVKENNIKNGTEIILI